MLKAVFQVEQIIVVWQLQNRTRSAPREC